MTEGTDRTLQATIKVNEEEIIDGIMKFPFSEENFKKQIMQKIRLDQTEYFFDIVEIKALNCESEVANNLFDFFASKNRSYYLEELTIDKMNPIID